MGKEVLEGPGGGRYNQGAGRTRPAGMPRPPVEVAALTSPDDPDRLLVEEHRLVRASQRGDREAFARLVERYYPRLYRWLYHLGHDRHEAEDLTQETFLKAFAGLAKFRAGTNFRAWLFRIAHNAFVNYRRAASRRREALPADVPANGAQPADNVLEKESQALLAEAVRQLPDEFRAAFLLRAEEGLSFRQIAQALGLTEETARWRVFKARQKLLRALTPPLEQEKP